MIFNKQKILSKIINAPNNADSDKSFRIYIEHGRFKICLTIIEYPGWNACSQFKFRVDSKIPYLELLSSTAASSNQIELLMNLRCTSNGINNVAALKTVCLCGKFIRDTISTFYLVLCADEQ
jgi:hypothetical protein